MEILQEFIRWWVSELGSLLPKPMAQSSNTAKIGLLVHIADGKCEIWSGYSEGRNRRAFRTDRIRPYRHRSWPNVTAFLHEVKKRRMSLNIVVRSEDCLIRELELPSRALPKADSILALDLERTTPFSRTDVYSAWIETGRMRHGTVNLRQYVVARSDIKPVLNTIRDAGFRIARLCVMEENGKLLKINLLSAEPVRTGRIERLLNIGLAAAFVGILALSLSATFLVFQRQGTALSKLRKSTTVARERAKEVQRKVSEAIARQDRIDGLSKRKAQTIPVFWIWEIVTRVLPDDAWLRELRVEGNEIYLSGYAGSAADLIGLLEASELFADVAFNAPVTAGQNPAAELFSLKMRLTET